MNKSRSTPTPLNANLNSINGTAGLLLSTPNTPNSTSSVNGTNLPCLNATATTNSSISSSSNDTQVTSQQASINNPLLSHSTNTNFSNNQLNSPYQDHEMSSPLMLMNGGFTDLQSNNNQMERLNGSLNSSNSSSSLNSNSGSSCVNNLITFNSANSLSSNLTKKIASLSNPGNLALNGSLTNGLNLNHLNNGLIAAGLNGAHTLSSPNFTANRENINCNNVQYIEFQMKANADNLDVSGESALTNSTPAAFVPQWRLLDTNLCNTNALLAGTDGFDYNQMNHFISGN